MTHMHLMVQIEAGCDPTVKVQLQRLCDNLYKLLIFNKIKSFMKLDNECTITKFIFFINPHNIITSNIAYHIIYIYIYQILQQNKFKLFIILLITLLWGFSYIFMSFDQFFVYKNFFPKYPSIFIRYIHKIKLPIYPWLSIFSSLRT